MNTKLIILLTAGLFIGVASQAQGRWEDHRNVSHDRMALRHDRRDVRVAVLHPASADDEEHAHGHLRYQKSLHAAAEGYYAGTSGRLLRR